MEIIRGLHNIRERHQGCASTIGTFDGVHLGHKQLLATTRARASEFNTRSLLVTFEPQPREYFRGTRVPARLTRFREKMALFEQEGIDQVLCIPFNEDTRSIQAQTVVDEFFVRMLAVRQLVVGDDFRFGSNAEGNFEMLQTAGEKHGFGVDQIPTLELDGQRVSSTLIREALADGDFALAGKLLGHSYFMMGSVVRGRQIGKTLGVPTANIRLQRYRSAIEGIFAVTVQDWTGITEGRPTSVRAPQSRAATHFWKYIFLTLRATSMGNASELPFTENFVAIMPSSRSRIFRSRCFETLKIFASGLTLRTKQGRYRFEH